ncbi:MAG: aspartate--tRNA(Asn) ligase [Promethearchaeota archaeon]
MADIILDQMGTLRKTHFSKDLSPALDGQEVVVGGWVTRIRKLGGMTFVVLQDKYGTLQITAKKGVVTDEIFEKLKTVGNHWTLLIKGTAKKFKDSVELIPIDVRILNSALEELPLDMTGKALSDLDTRLNHRTLDLRHPRNQAIFRIHHHLLREIRQYFNGRNFTEIITPKIIGSATEGGTELFPLKYFDQEAYLSQSAQLYKERLTSVFENVYELAPCYRAEKSFTNRHLCEIFVLDIEMAFADYTDVLVEVENMIHTVLSGIKTHCEADLKYLGQWDAFEVPSVPFPRYTYTETLEMLKDKCDITLEFGEDIPTEAYRKLGEILSGYYYITKWPMSAKPFYIMHDLEHPELSEGFDLQKGWLELISGGTRVHNKELLVKNLEKQGLNPASFERHLQAFDYGMPPHAGIGMGIARWLQVICGLDQVKEAVFFPRTPDRLDP